VRVDIKRWKLADGDRLLLCSDGLTDMLDDADITEVLAEGQFRRNLPAAGRRCAGKRWDGQRRRCPGALWDSAHA
jgi:serine/threonine protein phosphatase PrpC